MTAQRIKAIVAPENIGKKPRIRVVCGLSSPMRLLCVGHGAYGYGETPVEAYERWEDSRRYILTTPHRNVPSRFAKDEGAEQ